MFENKDKIVIVMEYASKGELYDYISERRKLSERETRHFFRQIVSAVHHCHKVRGLSPTRTVALSLHIYMCVYIYIYIKALKRTKLSEPIHLKITCLN